MVLNEVQAFININICKECPNKTLHPNLKVLPNGIVSLTAQTPAIGAKAKEIPKIICARYENLFKIWEPIIIKIGTTKIKAKSFTK